MSEYQEETAIKTIKGMASEIIETLVARTTELKQTIAKNKQKVAKEARKGAEENARLLHRLESLKKGCDTLISQRENLQQTLERETKELNKLVDENQNLERQYRELQEAGTSLIEKKNELQNKIKHQDAQYKVLSKKHKQLEEEVAEENRNYRTYLGIDIQKFKENVLKVSFSSLGVECYLILDFKNDPSVVECVPDLGVEKLDYIFKEECDFYGFIKRVRSEFLTYLGTR